MKYLLKVELDANHIPVFEKHLNVNSGEEFYCARGYDGFMEQVDKEWVLENQSDILNLTVSDDGELLPKALENKVRKVQSLICSYEVDDSGYYIIAIACPSDSTDEVLVQFHVSSDAVPEVLIYGIEVNIDFTQEALEQFACEHIAEYKWAMLENYFACI